MMLDVKRTWDDLVTRHAPDPARRERILRNRLYQQMSSALAGSQEYMAMEKLYELATDRDYDVIVLDTPPTAHALDFLEAPDRILDFLGNETARALLGPALGAGQLGLRLAQLGGGYIAKTLARFTGQAVLADLGDFLQGFQGMYDGFKERAAAVHALLSRPGGGVRARHLAEPGRGGRDARVPRAAPRRVDAGRGARREPRHAGPLAGAGAAPGRGARWPPPSRPPRAAPTAASRRASPAPSPSTRRSPPAERRALDRLFAALDVPRAVIPRLETDVHDLAGLARLAERL